MSLDSLMIRSANLLGAPLKDASSTTLPSCARRDVPSWKIDVPGCAGAAAGGAGSWPP